MQTISKSWKLISDRSRSRLKIYLVLIFFVSILEVVGISLIIPIIGAVSNDFSNSNPIIFEYIFFDLYKFTLNEIII